MFKRGGVAVCIETNNFYAKGNRISNGKQYVILDYFAERGYIRILDDEGAPSNVFAKRFKPLGAKKIVLNGVETYV